MKSNNMQFIILFVFGIITLFSYSRSEDINKEVVRVAQNAWYINQLEMFSDNIDDMKELDKVTLGAPIKHIYTSYRKILELDTKSDFLSICSFLKYEVPIILRFKALGSIYVSKKEIKGKTILKESGFATKSDILDLNVRLQWTYPQATIYYLLISLGMRGSWFPFILVSKDGKYFLMPANERSAELALLERYKLTPLSKVMPRLKYIAAKMELRKNTKSERSLIFE